MRFSRAVVKHRVVILIVALLLLVPSVMGMLATRINYDMLTYLPEDMDTVVGQNVLLDDFGKGAFSMLVVEDMPARDVSRLKAELEKIDHVDSVIWYDSIADLSIPMEVLPEKVYNEFNSDNATIMAVFFDDSTSAVDTKTDQLIRAAFHHEIPDTTKIIIAQRVASVQESDMILVMDHGRIMAAGTHEQLLENCDEYRSIYESQTKNQAQPEELQ